MIKMLIIVVPVCALLVFVYTLLCIAGKETPNPGKDFDERGPY